jgi:hypothetical protein
MRTLTPILVLAMVLGVSGTFPSHGGIAPNNLSQQGCGVLGSAHVRTTLYFGLSHPKGIVSESEWQNFLRTEVTPRFPNGFTVWEADGQWRKTNGSIGKERAKVLLLVHEESAAVRTDLAQMVENYKHTYQQESVLWETAPVCASF